MPSAAVVPKPTPAKGMAGMAIKNPPTVSMTRSRYSPRPVSGPRKLTKPCSPMLINPTPMKAHVTASITSPAEELPISDGFSTNRNGTR